MRDLPPTFIAVNFPLELNGQAVGPGEESGTVRAYTICTRTV